MALEPLRELQLPDGSTVYNVPDEVTDQEIQQAYVENKPPATEEESLLENVKDKDDVPRRLLKMESLEKQLNNKIKNIEKSVKFYEENDTCPSCKQDIEDHHKKSMFDDKASERKEVEDGISDLTQNINNTNERMTEINSILFDVDNVEVDINKKQIKINSSLQYINTIQNRIGEVLNEGTEIQETKDELNQLIGEGKK